MTAVLAFLLTRPPPAPKVLSYTRITHDGHVKTHLLGPPSLVTDGARLYFAELARGGGALAQTSTSGGETALVPTPFPNTALFDISPDRSELLVASYTALEPELALWILPVPAGTPRRLGEVLGHDGTWSPDGQQIVYAKGTELYLVKSDGTDARKLLTVDGTPWLPRWSPDGKRLRFTVTDAHRVSSSLWEVSSDGSNPHPLLPGWNSPPAECCGNWAVDGRYFVFQSARQGRTDIWAIGERTDPF